MPLSNLITREVDKQHVPSNFLVFLEGKGWRPPVKAQTPSETALNSEGWSQDMISRHDTLKGELAKRLCDESLYGRNVA